MNALRRYQILDTPPGPAFNHIAEMAANFFQVPMAGVSLVDEDRVWFKSRLGVRADQTARDAGLCASAILSPGVYYLWILAIWERDHFGSEVELPLKGTPCESVLHGEVAHGGTAIGKMLRR